MSGNIFAQLSTVSLKCSILRKGFGTEVKVKSENNRTTGFLSLNDSK